MKRLLSLLVLALISGHPTLGAQAAPSNTGWYVENGSETVIVFVHGILSNSVSCWTAGNQTYWPDLIRKDGRFGAPDIYLGGYYTEPASGLFRISDAADELYSYMRVPDQDGRAPLMNKRHLLFVAHSTGGLVIRQMLLRHAEAFKEKTVGLALMASPSRGSDWGNRLDILRRLAGNKMAADLARGSSYTQELDRSFAEMVETQKIPRLVGVDAFESKFIVPRWWWWDEEYVVSADNSASYFGWYKVLSGTDHFSIVKPDSLGHASHQLLVDFFLTKFVPERQSTVRLEPIDRWGLPASSTGRKLYQARIRPAGAAMDEASFNDQWEQAVTHSITRVLSDTLVYAPVELSFEGTEVFPRQEPDDLEALADAGRDLNALAVTLTSAQTAPAGGELITTTYFRQVANGTQPDAFNYPPIEDKVPAFGPVTASQALSKYWGYYVLLALANRCLALPNDQAGCDREKLTAGLQRARRALGANDRALTLEIGRLIETSRRAR